MTGPGVKCVSGVLKFCKLALEVTRGGHMFTVQCRVGWDEIRYFYKYKNRKIHRRLPLKNYIFSKVCRSYLYI